MNKYGYRSIQNMRLTMHDINVIVGSNGCGKSNLYKAVHLLAKAVNGELANPPKRCTFRNADSKFRAS
jgi:predicted ATPase